MNKLDTKFLNIIRLFDNRYYFSDVSAKMSNDKRYLFRIYRFEIIDSLSGESIIIKKSYEVDTLSRLLGKYSKYDRLFNKYVRETLVEKHIIELVDENQLKLDLDI